jgi:hypothetical protein
MKLPATGCTALYPMKGVESGEEDVQFHMGICKSLRLCLWQLLPDRERVLQRHAAPSVRSTTYVSDGSLSIGARWQERAISIWGSTMRPFVLGPSRGFIEGSFVLDEDQGKRAKIYKASGENEEKLVGFRLGPKSSLGPRHIVCTPYIHCYESANVLESVTSHTELKSVNEVRWSHKGISHGISSHQHRQCIHRKVNRPERG